jgi:hypothetical protein
MNMARKFLTFAQGKKTYLIVLISIGVGVAQARGYHIPWWFDIVLAATGLGTVRAGITAESKKSTEDMAALIQMVLANVTTADTTGTALPPVVKLPSGRTITIGQPSNVPVRDEQAETDALNDAQRRQ